MCRIRRFVVAWVRMCESSPIWSPWATMVKMSMGPLACSASLSTGATASRRKRSRWTASGVSTPNHAVFPGPWLRPE